MPDGNPPGHAPFASALRFFASNLGAWGAYTVAALVAFWPMPRLQGTHLPVFPLDPDLQTGVWLPWHLARQFRAGEQLLWAPELVHPEGLDLTLYVWNLGCPLLAAPLYLLLQPVAAFNLSTWLFAGLNGVAAHHLARALGARRAVPWAVGLWVTWAFYPCWQLASGRPEQGFLAPLLVALAAFHHLLRGPGPLRAGGVLGLATGIAGLCYWFHPLFFAMGILPVVLWKLATGGISRRRVLGLVLAVVVAVLVVAPAAGPVLASALEDGSVYRRVTGNGMQGAMLQHERVQHALSLRGLLWPLLPDPARRLEHGLPLTLVAGLLLAATRRSSRSRAAPGFVLVAVGLGFALAPRLGAAGGALYAAIEGILPAFERFWWPDRFRALAVVGGGWVLACGLAGGTPSGGSRPVASRGGSGFRLRELWLAAVLPLGLVLELHGGGAPVAGGWGRELPVTALDRQLGQEPWTCPLLQVPVMTLPNDYQVLQVIHRQALAGGPAQTHPQLAPAALQARTHRPPLAWFRLPRAGIPESRMPDVGPAGVARALRKAGFCRVIVRAPSFPAGAMDRAWAEDRLGPPTWEEPGLLAWDLFAVASGEEPSGSPSPVSNPPPAD